MQGIFQVAVAAVVMVMTVSVREATAGSDLPPRIFYYVTVRDFMSASCVPGSANFDNQCPNDAGIKAAVTAGTYSGHSDFQRTFTGQGSGVVNQYKAPYAGGLNLPLTPNGAFKPYVLSTIQPDTTGILKMKYCKGEEGYLCDFNANPRLVNDETSFSTWYNDNTKFSIRSGYQQVLFLNPGSNQYLYFASGPQSTDVDGNNFFDPIKENGLNGWPLSPLEVSLASKKFWITTEIHTSFQYRGNESFTFAGDDDVHVFINRRLAINLAGVHSSTSLTIKLDDFATQLGIVKGEIYEFDMFHAERQTVESNFGLTTTLSEACNVVNSNLRTNGTDVEQAIDWTVNGITNNSDWFVLAGPGFGLFDPVGKAINLMTPGIPNVVSYMFHSDRVNVGSGFSFNFNFQMTGVGHGFSVIFHARSQGLENLNGGMGPNLGVKNTDNSFAVVFDECPEFPAPCATQQLSLHYKRDGNKLNSVFNDTRKVFDGKVLQKWNDNKVHRVDMFYFATPDWLEIYVDNSLRLVQKNFSVIDILGGRDSFVGFASASSDVTGMNVRLTNVQISTIKVVERFSSLADFEDLSQKKTFFANGRDSTTFTVKTRDACLSDIQFGGLASLAQGRLVSTTTVTPVTSNSQSEESGRRLRDDSRSMQSSTTSTQLVLVASVEDDDNGEYTLRFTTDIVANFSAHIAFGSGCQWNGTDFVAATRDCFALNVDDAVSSLPFITLAPTGFEASSSLPTTTIVGLGVSAGVICSIGSILIFFGMRSRNQWRRDKRFIEAGRLAALETNIRYEGDLELEALQYKLQKTIEELHKTRARKNDSEEHMMQIQNLLRQKGELQEIVRRQKAEKMGFDPDADLTYSQHVSMISQSVRKSFAQVRMSDRMSRAISWRPSMSRATSSSNGGEQDQAGIGAPTFNPAMMVSKMRMSLQGRFNGQHASNGGDPIPGQSPSTTLFNPAAMMNKVRWSMTRGFNTTAQAPSLASSSGKIQDEMSTVNPLFMRLKEEQQSRPATMSTDSTNSRDRAPTATSSPTFKSAVVLAGSSSPHNLPRVPPRPDASTVGSVTSTAPNMPSWSSNPASRVPPRSDTIQSSAPRVPPRSDTIQSSAPRVPPRSDTMMSSSSSASSTVPRGPPRQGVSSVVQLSRPPPASIDDSI